MFPLYKYWPDIILIKESHRNMLHISGLQGEHIMNIQTDIDCILVGYNELDFDAFAGHQQAMSKHSGAYHEVKTNSLFVNGKRLPYMEVINQAITNATGRNPHLNVFETPPLSVNYLRNFLNQRKLHVEAINFFNYEKTRFKDLLHQSPIAVAITTTFYIDNAPIIEVVKFVRKHSPNTKIIVGGPHIYNISCDYDQLTQDYILQEIGADIYITDSQGENTLCQVMYHLRERDDLSRVPNLIYIETEGGLLKRTHRLVEQNDLDQNSIDWQTFSPEELRPITYLRTARSCPFSCSFCNYPTMAGTHVVSSLDVVERELTALREAGTEVIVFIDDTFNVPLPRFKKLLRMMIENDFQFQWVSFLRCGNVDEEALDLMEASGCLGVLLGIESGDQTILNNMNKAVKLKRYRWGIEELKKRNIATFASLICGFPGETEATIRNTIDFINETGPTFFNVQLYYHDRRAPIHHRSAELGIKGGGYSWQHNTMTWQEAATWAQYMFKEIQNSVPLGLYSFSLWGIAYLVAKGITIETIKSFGEITRNLLISGFNDTPVDSSQPEKQLIELFRGVAVKPHAGANGVMDTTVGQSPIPIIPSVSL
jgi:p-methyltransferase